MLYALKNNSNNNKPGLGNSLGEAYKIAASHDVLLRTLVTAEPHQLFNCHSLSGHGLLPAFASGDTLSQAPSQSFHGVTRGVLHGHLLFVGQETGGAVCQSPPECSVSPWPGQWAPWFSVEGGFLVISCGTGTCFLYSVLPHLGENVFFSSMLRVVTS
jgi:hypothetical protein